MKPEENTGSDRIWAYFGARVNMFPAILARISRANKLPIKRKRSVTQGHH
jgi:hypothetical protein